MSAAPKTTSREQEEIYARMDDFMRAWNKHEARDMASMFAEDADVINPLGRAARSRYEIETLFRDEHAGPLRDSRLMLKPERVRILTPEIAITDHLFEITGARDEFGKDLSVRGYLTQVMQKHGDLWLVVSFRPLVPAPMQDRQRRL